LLYKPAAKTNNDAGFARMVVSFFFAAVGTISNFTASEVPSFYKRGLAKPRMFA
jgi:hypothetical protein